MVDAKTSTSIAADMNGRGRHERAPNINCILHKRTRRHLDREGEDGGVGGRGEGGWGGICLSAVTPPDLQQ